MAITNLAHNAAIGYLGDPQPRRSLARWARNYGLSIEDVAEALARLTHQESPHSRVPQIDTENSLVHFNDGHTDPVPYRLRQVRVWDIGSRRHTQCLNGLVEIQAHGLRLVFDGFAPLKAWAALNHIERTARAAEFVTRDDHNRRPQ